MRLTKIIVIVSVVIVLAAVIGLGRKNDPSGPVLIPLGDSITDGTLNYGSRSLGYRQYLQDELGVSAYTFRGQFKSGPYGTKYQRAHSGVIGETLSQIQARLEKNLAMLPRPPAQKHSVILIHAGTNDLSDVHIKTASDVSGFVETLGEMVKRIHDFDPSVDIYVALLIPAKQEHRNASIDLYNAQVVRMVDQKAYPNLYYVDMNAAFKKDTFGLCRGDWRNNCMFDNLHPNYAGYEVMGKQWAACIRNPSGRNCNGH